MYIDYNNRIVIFSYLFFKYKMKIKWKQFYLVFILNKLIDYHNEVYLNMMSEIGLNQNGLKFDSEQIKAIYSNELFNLVVAGAGSGKTSLIVGKINYLIEKEHLLPNEIICLAFTNEACSNLKSRLKYNVNVLTFHKLSLSILNNKYRINNNCLSYVIDEYFSGIVIDHKHCIKKLIKLIGKSDYKKYQYYLSIGLFDNIKKVIGKFIKLFIVEGYNYIDFLKIKRYKNLMAIIFDIYYLYMEEMEANGEIDLNTLIIKATNNVKNVNLGYKYIIIDEFQDISKVRLNLIYSIIDYTGAKLLAVGDDYQSIYGFSGTNLKYYIKLCNTKYQSKVIKLQNNYRCCKEIVYISNKFISKNKKQIKKNIRGLFSIALPIVIIKEKNNILEKLLIHLSSINSSILILGRNNNDINNYIDKKQLELISKQYNNKIEYKTVHSAKGLEADCVIIINLKDSKLGFPSQLREHDLINYVFPKEKYPYAEERRLFYVAMTRSKGKVYLLQSEKPSVFFKEIKKCNQKNITYLKL